MDIWNIESVKLRFKVYLTQNRIHSGRTDTVVQKNTFFLI